MDELEFYNGQFTGPEIDEAVNAALNPDQEPDAENESSLISSAGAAKQLLTVSFGTLTGTGTTVTATVTDTAITADHVVISHSIGTPAAVMGDLNVETLAGSATVSGKINGSTTLTVILGRPGLSIS